jgi:hypothetical protein
MLDLASPIPFAVKVLRADFGDANGGVSVTARVAQLLDQQHFVTCDPNLLSTVEFVGPSSPNPKATLIPQNFQFSPALGFAWQVPFFGEGKTTMRGGFQRTYGGAGSQFSGGLTSGPGGDATAGAINVNDPKVAAILATGRALNLSDLASLVPGTPTRAPGARIPVATW